jgi:DNA-binding response OmpR family regulator
VPASKPSAEPRILLVHADELVVQRVRDALRERPWHLTVAKDGAQGLAEVDAHPPQVVVADIALPKLDGITLLRALRGREDTREIPLVFLSGISDPMVLMTGLAAGARYFLTVPFQEDDLRFKLGRLL